MKAKSMKMRLLITLHALYRYTDKDHRMNGVKLNKFLKPHGLECRGATLGDTVTQLREFGIDVRSKGEWEHQGVWIEDRFLKDAVLEKLVFSVCTNPFLSDCDAEEILNDLKPLVTIYQEPVLSRDSITGDIGNVDAVLYNAYYAMQKAIQTRRRVQYTVEEVRYDEDAKTVFVEPRWERLFTPKCTYKTGSDIYAVGYDHFLRRITAVNLRSVTEIRPAFKHSAAVVERALERMKDIEPRNYIPGEVRNVIYQGPAVFRCRGQYVEDLYRKFGPPSGPVEKDARCRTIYPVQEAVICTETLAWLANIPGHGIRFAAPEGLLEAVRSHCKELSEILTERKLPANPAKQKKKEHSI